MKSIFEGLRRKKTGGPPSAADGSSAETPGWLGKTHPAFPGPGMPDLAMAPATERTSEPVPVAAPEGEKVTFELGDILTRIPAHLLKDGKPDPARPLTVDISELAKCLADGRSTTPLAAIYRAAPDIFVEAAPPDGQMEIRYPWRRILQLLQESPPGEGLSASLAKALQQLKQAQALQKSLENAAATAEAPPAKARGVVPGPKRLVNGRKALDAQVSWFSAQVETGRTEKAPVAPAAKAPLQAVKKQAAPPVPAAARAFSMSDLSPAKTDAPVPPPHPAAMPDLKLAAAPAPEDSRPVDAPSAPPAHGNEEELARLNAERDAAVSRLAGETDAAARERDHLQREQETCVGLIMAQHESEIAKLRGEHGAALAELNAARGQDAEAIATLKSEHAHALEEAHVEAARKLSELTHRWDAERQQFEARIRELESNHDKAMAEAAGERAQRAAEFAGGQENLRRSLAARIEEVNAEAAAMKDDFRTDLADAGDQWEKAITALAEERDRALAAADPGSAAALAALAEKENQLVWKDRLIAELEGEVETYRSRIKTVLKQRDQLVAEKESLAAAAGTARELTQEKKWMEEDLQAQAELIASLEQRLARFTDTENESDIVYPARPTAGKGGDIRTHFALEALTDGAR